MKNPTYSIGWGDLETSVMICDLCKRISKQTDAIMYSHKCDNLIQFNNLICHFYALNEIDIKRLKENKNFTKTHSNMSKFISYLSFRSACPRFTNVGSHISFREDEVWSSVNSNNWTAFRYLNIKEKSLSSPCRAKKN